MTRGLISSTLQILSRCSYNEFDIKKPPFNLNVSSEVQCFMLEILSFYLMYTLVFKTGVLLCSSSWHETFYVDKAVLLRAGIIDVCYHT